MCGNVHVMWCGVVCVCMSVCVCVCVCLRIQVCKYMNMKWLPQFRRLHADSQRHAWFYVLFRHGAHNWEGPGALTAMTALEVLSRLTHNHPWIERAADAQHVLFEGIHHFMCNRAHESGQRLLNHVLSARLHPVCSSSCCFCLLIVNERRAGCTG